MRGLFWYFFRGKSTKETTARVFAKTPCEAENKIKKKEERKKRPFFAKNMLTKKKEKLV